MYYYWIDNLKKCNRNKIGDYFVRGRFGGVSEFALAEVPFWLSGGGAWCCRTCRRSAAMPGHSSRQSLHLKRKTFFFFFFFCVVVVEAIVGWWRLMCWLSVLRRLYDLGQAAHLWRRPACCFMC